MRRKVQACNTSAQLGVELSMNEKTTISVGRPGRNAADMGDRDAMDVAGNRGRLQVSSDD